MSSFAAVLFPRTKYFFLSLLLGSATLLSAGSGAPEWLKQAAQAPFAKYPDDPGAVKLLHEQTTTVEENGQVRSLHRVAYRILNSSGKDYSTVVVHYDNETKLLSLKGWTIPPQGGHYEVKEKDAVETSLFNDSFFASNRQKMMTLPQAVPGSVIGYEYEKLERPYVNQDQFVFNHVIPVMKARYTLSLPAGWEMKSFFLNHTETQPKVFGNQYVWEADNLPAIKDEPGMPSYSALWAKLGLTFFSSTNQNANRNWREVGAWSNRLNQGRRSATPELQTKVRALVSGKTGLLEKIRAIGAFAQRDVRYVDIQIGIGGWQPHMAGDIFNNRYGDCKDKVTIFSTMLKEVGVDSFYMLVHTKRGVVNEAYPNPFTFNHVVAAVKLPEASLEGMGSMYSIIKHPKLGNLLIFDPTDDITTVGYLPASLQGNQGLLVSDEGGELMILPLQPADANKLHRSAKLKLNILGSLSGEVEERRTGASARDIRAELRYLQEPQRIKRLEVFLASYFNGFKVTDYKIENLDDFEKELIVRFKFETDSYAKKMGPLTLVRPRIFGTKADGVVDLKERKYPFELEAPTLQTDDFEIELPPGMIADELPPAMKAAAGYAAYESETKLDGNVLRYKRSYKVNKVWVALENLKEFNDFNRKIIMDERSSAVLKVAP